MFRVQLSTCSDERPAGSPTSAPTLGSRVRSLLSRSTRAFSASKARDMLAHIDVSREVLVFCATPTIKKSRIAAVLDEDALCHTRDLEVPLNIARAQLVGHGTIAISLLFADEVSSIPGASRALETFNKTHGRAQGGAWSLRCDSAEEASRLLDQLTRNGAIGAGLQDRYQLTRVVGRGSFGLVFKAVDLESGQRVAVKIFNAKKCPDHAHPLVEAAMLRKARHASVLEFKGMYEVRDPEFLNCRGIRAEKAWALVTDLIQGGDVHQAVVNDGRMPEKRASKVVRQLLRALAGLHGSRVVHRDVKPENLMFTGSDDEVKLVDFGLATEEVDEQAMRLRVGTPGCVAPEVFNGIQTCKVDCFSAGVVLFFLLAGGWPFDGEEAKEVLANNLRCRVKMQAVSHISQGARSLLTGLLHPIPEKRLSAREALRHPWLQSFEAKKEKPAISLPVKRCASMPGSGVHDASPSVGPKSGRSSPQARLSAVKALVSSASGGVPSVPTLLEACRLASEATREALGTDLAVGKQASIKSTVSAQAMFSIKTVETSEFS